MLLQPDCIPCILQMTISALRKMPLEETEVRDLYSEILKLPALRGRVWDMTSEEALELVMKKISAATDNHDPFYLEKMEQNRKALSLYASMKELVNEAPDPLYEAITLAAMANAIDFMMSLDPQDMKAFIKEKVKIPISRENYKTFRERIQGAKLLLFLADNAGEIVFDKILIETIKASRLVEVVFVVRSVPTLNDATLNEARAVGIEDVATLMENGIDGPLPGTFVSRCSKEVREILNKADLVISKGGGNFGTLDDQKEHLKKDISFILLSKCYPYEKRFGVPVGAPVLLNYFGSS